MTRLHIPYLSTYTVLVFIDAWNIVSSYLVFDMDIVKFCYFKCGFIFYLIFMK